MLDISHRWGMARRGIWQAQSFNLELPGILFLASQRFPAPLFAEALISSERLSDPRPVIVDRGSVFLPREGPKDCSVPPDTGVPPGSESKEAVDQIGSCFRVVSRHDDISESDAEAFVLGGAASLLQEPREFAAAMVDLRKVIGPNRILYCPGMALPANLALLVYCGVDLVDSVAVLFEAGRGNWLNIDGSWHAEDFESYPCRCPACLSSEGKEAITGHNEAALWEEMELVRACIISGELRELVERRAGSSPWNAAVLRHLDLRYYEFQETYFPVSGNRIQAYTHQSLARPDIVRFRRRLKERYSKPPSARVLLLLPCSARKPYALSRSHRMFREAVVTSGNPWAVHEVIVTSPLGLVPRELEITYPAAHYDIPVTGDWSLDEAAIVSNDLRMFLDANKYDRIIAHLDVERPFVEGVLSGAMFTCEGRPTDADSLGALADTLREQLEAFPLVRRGDRLREDMAALARFQFGDGGENLLKDAELRGRFPGIKILRDGTQLAMLTDRGMLSLTLDGGNVLSSLNLYCVEIDAFYPQGSVFAVGVEGADDRIRPGDDVVVRHAGEVRAVGVAQMPAAEMVQGKRGVAVRVRHALRSKPI